MVCNGVWFLLLSIVVKNYISTNYIIDFFASCFGYVSNYELVLLKEAALFRSEPWDISLLQNTAITFAQQSTVKTKQNRLNITEMYGST